MNKYKLVSIYKDNQGTTCQHCGRGIKNIAVLEDIITGERITVGLTCLDKLMELKETFIQKVQKESKKYYKLETEIVEYRIKENENLLNSNGAEVTWYIQALVKLIKQIELMNNLGTKGYIQLNNIESLKNECNVICIKYGYKPEY